MRDDAGGTRLTKPPVVVPVEPPKFARWLPTLAISCAKGHPIKNSMIPTPAGFMPCTETACGEWVYVVACNAASIAYVVRASYKQMQEIKRLDLPPLDTMEFLGCAYPGAEH